MAVYFPFVTKDKNGGQWQMNNIFYIFLKTCIMPVCKNINLTSLLIAFYRFCSMADPRKGPRQSIR